jgi:hypothetical protein
VEELAGLNGPDRYTRQAESQVKTRKKCADLEAPAAEHKERDFFVPANFALKKAASDPGIPAQAESSNHRLMKSATRDEMDNS